MRTISGVPSPSRSIAAAPMICDEPLPELNCSLICHWPPLSITMLRAKVCWATISDEPSSFASESPAVVAAASGPSVPAAGAGGSPERPSKSTGGP